MSENDLIATVAGFIAAAIAITVPVYITTTNSTERNRACVESGGSYVNVPNTSRMECKR